MQLYADGEYHKTMNCDDFDMDAYWDSVFNSKQACIDTIKSFGYHDESIYDYIMLEIEDASPDWYVTVPEDIMKLATGPFSEWNDLNIDCWEHDQCVTLITALRYHYWYVADEVNQNK